MTEKEEIVPGDDRLEEYHDYAYPTLKRGPYNEDDARRSRALKERLVKQLNADPTYHRALAADTLICSGSDIYPDCKVWVYFLRKGKLRKPGVVKKVKISKAIVTMANSQGIQTDYDVDMDMLGLRDDDEAVIFGNKWDPVEKGWRSVQI